VISSVGAILNLVDLIDILHNIAHKKNDQKVIVYMCYFDLNWKNNTYACSLALNIIEYFIVIMIASQRSNTIIARITRIQILTCE